MLTNASSQDKSSFVSMYKTDGVLCLPVPLRYVVSPKLWKIIVDTLSTDELNRCSSNLGSLLSFVITEFQF